MSFPETTIDLPEKFMKVQGGTFRLAAEGDVFGSQNWGVTPRGAPPRFKRWRAEVEFAPFTKGAETSDLRFEWDVFVDRLDGLAAAFRMFDPLRVYPRGFGAGIWNPRMPSRLLDLGQYTVLGAGLIDGKYQISGGSPTCTVATDAARHANQIHLAGLVPSSLALKAGDTFGLGGNLYMVTADALSDADGESTVSFSWRLWTGALAGDLVQLVKPTARFVLAAPDAASMSRSFSTVSASVTAVELPYVD